MSMWPLSRILVLWVAISVWMSSFAEAEDEGRVCSAAHRTDSWITSLDEGAAGAQICGAKKGFSGIGLMFWPLGLKELVGEGFFNRTAGFFEAGPHVVKGRCAAYFIEALKFSGLNVPQVLQSCVAADETGEDPMKNTVDFRLVKRVKGKDGEWWSGGGLSAALSVTIFHQNL